MFVAQPIRARVEAKLQECIVKAEAKFPGHKFPMPTIEYTNAAGMAGQANSTKWRIKLSGILLNDTANVEEMINCTAPHELAHLITGKVYPHTEGDASERFRARMAGLKAPKRDIHGADWRYVMRVLGVDPERTHDMEVSDDLKHLVKGGRSTSTAWICPACRYEFKLGPKRSARHSVIPSFYCNKGHSTKQYLVRADGTKPVHASPTDAVKAMMDRIANSTLTVTDLTGKFPTTRTYPPVRAATQAVRPVIPEPTKPVGGGSKIDMCWTIYRARPTLARGELIKLFVAQAGCTTAGASTYVATCKKRYESGER